ncbi:ribonuclease HII [Streptomonospora sp. PA3]|uniref:ribonuclease HII n=1 Tax=Streptomonospora sp. PA3 TaxID=2607326 RepID=UPI0013071728|nr:ribonuclease HII [Streptomonospora sp. PA3]
MAAPTYDLERELRADGAVCVAGVDEVGRGAWAGPVVVCAAVADGTPPPEGLTDSKRIARQRRTAMAEQVREWVRDHAIGSADPGEIDELGMTRALRLAATRALERLAPTPDAVVLDGKHDYLGAPWRVRTRIQADSSCVAVAAASVLAKVHRDAFMAGLHPDFPDYGFDTCVGYPSPVHRAALAERGPTPHHRMTWSYLDDLPEWRHLRKPRPDPGGQLPLL